MIDPLSRRSWLLSTRALALRALGSWLIARVVVMTVATMTPTDRAPELAAPPDPFGLPIGTVAFALLIAWLDLHRTGEWRWYRLLGVGAWQIVIILVTLTAVLDQLAILVAGR